MIEEVTVKGVDLENIWRAFRVIVVEKLTSSLISLNITNPGITYYTIVNWLFINN